MLTSCISIIVMLLIIAQLASSNNKQNPIVQSYNTTIQAPHPKKIAIIGAGIAGATTAYYLQDSIRHLPTVDITIFESSSEIGGRIKSVRYRGKTVEVGAPSASPYDWCFLKAMRHVGLAPKEPEWLWESMRKETVGTSDGEKLVNVHEHDPQCGSWWDLVKSVWREGERAWLMRKVSPPMWWELVKLIWTYGLSPWKFHKTAISNLESMDGFNSRLRSGGYVKPVESLKTEFDQLDLRGQALNTASSYLRSLNLSAQFLGEVIEPLTRARFGQNLDRIRAIAADIAWRGYFSREVSIQDGNYRLVDRLITLSNAELKLHSRVKEIGFGSSRLYSLLTESNSAQLRETVLEHGEFDAVVIATPFQLNEIKFHNILPTPIPDSSANVHTERHITHFATAANLSPDFFNLSPGTNFPNHIYTTVNSSHDPEIFSITTVDDITYLDMTYCSNTPGTPASDLEDCDTVISERVYRIMSDTAIDDKTLENMVDAKSVTSDEIYGDDLIAFVHRQVWPYVTAPYEARRMGVGNVEIADDLYYTGGMDDIFSSLEMSCRMGGNVASKLHLKLAREKYNSCW